MKTIWKFALDGPKVTHYMPASAKILCVNSQDGEMFMWAEVNSSNAIEERRFEVFGTGHEIHEDMGIERNYLGTALLDGGALVFHVYERTGI